MCLISTSDLRVEIERPKNIQALQSDWEKLEVEAGATVFLSWKWIGTWLAVFQPEAEIIRVYHLNRVVGMAVLVESKQIRHKVLQVKTLNLHQTGNSHLDQIWIEYNGLLCKKGFELTAFKAVISFLKDKRPSWDELSLSGLDSGLAEQYVQVANLESYEYWRTPYYGVDLEKVRHAESTNSGYLQQISKNSRYQIQRSRRQYQKRGEIRIERPENIEQALDVFGSIAPNHIRRWGAEVGQSGFVNPKFVQFHRTYIERCWPFGVDLVVVKAGSTPIATFYNLIHGKTVYFYLCGLKLEGDNRFKPGLLGHVLSIQDYARKGFHYYDFMGGEARYKESLGCCQGELVQISLQRNRLKLKLEHVARRVREKLIS